ncbi:conserved hypothetical protein, partial [Haemophilus influenzae HK1212]
CRVNKWFNRRTHLNLSAKGKVTVNAEGNVDNEGVIDGHTATSVTAGQKVTNHKAARIVSENGDVYVITNGIVDNNGFIQGKTGTTVVEGQRQSKDNLMSDLIHTLGDIQRTVRSSLRAAENEQHPSSSAKSLMFYDKGRAVNKVASIISHGSVCSVEFDLLVNHVLLINDELQGSDPHYDYDYFQSLHFDDLMVWVHSLLLTSLN